MARNADCRAGNGSHDSPRSRHTPDQSGGPSSFGDLSRYALLPPPPPAFPASRPHTAPEATGSIPSLDQSRSSNTPVPRLPTVPSPLNIASHDRRPATSINTHTHARPIPPPPRHVAWPTTPVGSRYDPPTSTQPLMSPISPFQTRPTTGSSTGNSEYARGRVPYMPGTPRPPAAHAAVATSTSAGTSPIEMHQPIAGYQADYTRIGHLRAPSAPALGSHGGGVPLESLMMVRVGLAPEAGARDVRGPTERWTWNLEIIQEPIVGKALEFDDLSPDFPRLIPPLIVRLIVHDENDQPVEAGNATLQPIVTHLVTQLFLQSGATGSPRPLIERRSRSMSMTVAEDTVTYSTMPGALRSATAQLLHFRGRPEWLFLFPDLVVRPRGQFQLEVVLLNVRAPGPNGTSTGITSALARAVTEPFDNLPAATFAQGQLAVPHPTPLSYDLARQGVEGLLDGNGANDA